MKSFALLLPLLLTGCSLFGYEDGGRAANTGEPFSLRVGESIQLTDIGATLRLDEASDQRCPVDVVCASAGTASVQLAFSRAPQAPASISLLWPWADGQGLDDEGRIFIETKGLRFTLLSLLPYPDTRVPNPAPSVVTLRVDRLP